MLVKFNMLSVNQIMAQVKLNEMWKVTHIANYPIKIEQLSFQEDSMNTRARSSGFLLKESKNTCFSQKTFVNDAIHIWNLGPNVLKECTSLYSAKKAIKTFVATLPI